MSKKFKNICLSVAFACVGLSALADNTPKYVFYYIGDGMGMQPLMTAQAYNRDILKNEKPLLMLQFPVASWAMTYSASSPITDSAAAGTALAAGYKTNNGMVGVTADTVAVNSVARELKDMGYGVGVITSVYLDDATPGAYYAHVASRSMYYDIDVQAAKSGYDFMAGAGMKGLIDSNGQPTDIPILLSEQGVQLVRGRDGINQINSERVILLSEEGMPNYNVGYTIDSIPGALTLPLITETCLQHLEKQSPEKFFMMVEGGNIDYSGHSNDGGAAIKETLNFNEALKVAYDFYNEHPNETLIIVTADHDTGGLAIGSIFTGYNMQPQYVDYQKISKDRFNDECREILKSDKPFTWNDMKEMLKKQLGFWAGVPVTEKQTASLEEKFAKTFELRNSEDQKTLYRNFDEFSTEVFHVFNEICGIGWVTYNHTGNYVPVYAIGVDAEQFSGIHDNTEIPVILRKITNLEK